MVILTHSGDLKKADRGSKVDPTRPVNTLK
jgi:hypothetical protein